MAPNSGGHSESSAGNCEENKGVEMAKELEERLVIAFESIAESLCTLSKCVNMVRGDDGYLCLEHRTVDVIVTNTQE